MEAAVAGSDPCRDSLLPRPASGNLLRHLASDSLLVGSTAESKYSSNPNAIERRRPTDLVVILHVSLVSRWVGIVCCVRISLYCDEKEGTTTEVHGATERAIKREE